MTIADKITSKLKEEYAKGATQCELAEKYSLKQGQIQKLLSGQRKVGGFRLDTIQKMFPAATISLSGSATQTQTGNSGTCIQANNSIVHSTGGIDRMQLMKAIIAMDIPDDVRTKILRSLAEM